MYSFFVAFAFLVSAFPCFSVLRTSRFTKIACKSAHNLTLMPALTHQSTNIHRRTHVAHTHTRALKHAHALTPFTIVQHARARAPSHLLTHAYIHSQMLARCTHTPTHTTLKASFMRIKPILYQVPESNGLPRTFYFYGLVKFRLLC